MSLGGKTWVLQLVPNRCGHVRSIVWSGDCFSWAVSVLSHDYPISVLLGYSKTWNFTQFLSGSCTSDSELMVGLESGVSLGTSQSVLLCC